MKFTRKELERLEVPETDIELMLKCQKTLPILFENDSIAKYSVNAIDLWNQIGSQNNFSHWLKNNILESDNISSDDYEVFFCKVPTWEKNPRTHMIDIEIIDNITAMGLNPSQLSANKISKSCMISLDTAKDIVMYVGAMPRTNKETKEISRMYRKYFRVLESVVEKNKEWWATRDPEKIEYKKMCAEIDSWCFRIWKRKAYRADYCVEADMLNVIVSGKTSQQLKAKYGVSTYDLIRDYLKKEHNEELLFLEQQNQVLLLMDMGFTERKNMLAKMHEVRFKNNITETVA